MGFLDRFKKKTADTTRRTRVNIEQRFEIKRTAISGSMSKFYMARDRENDNTIGLKVADAKKTKLFESRFKELKKPSEGEIAISIDHPHVVNT
ncbi:MAG: serine/threonine protein kinase, partial [Pirellulaceae bacterium]